MRAVLLFCLALVGCSCGVPTQLPLEPAPAVVDPFDSLVALVQDGEAYCSGAVVATDWGPRILTAAHCVELAETAQVAAGRQYSGHAERGWVFDYTADVLAVSDGDYGDLALLSYPAGLGCTPVSLSAYAPLVGEPVVALGHPLGVPYVATRGHVTSTHPEVHMTLHNSGLAPGMSGGPLLDSAGNLVGINVAMLCSRAGCHTTFGWAMDLVTIRNFLQESL